MRDIAWQFKDGLKFQTTALGALHEACEHYAVGLFEDANMLAIHAKRQTIKPRDMTLGRWLRGDER